MSAGVISVESNREQRLLEVLAKYWGYSSLRPLQLEAMDAVLEGRDSLVVMPTGAGKSICYQAPALLSEGLTVVVSPLISLMKDQVDGLLSCGIAAAQLNSSLDPIEQHEIEDAVRRGKMKILFVSPERLAVRGFRKLLASVKVDSFAIDEAHCISHWGHDFRPEYRQLRGLREEFPHASLHGYTATATEQVRKDIVQQLGLNDPAVLVGSFDRANLVYRIVTRRQEIAQIEKVISRHKDEAGIIYCIRRRDVDDVSAALRRKGYNALPYHAGLDPELRKKTQDAFINEKCDIVVATVAFGMGIDRSNVRYVIHLGMPKSIEHYQQETGRAGRDGLEAECVLLYSPADANTWRLIFENSSGDGEGKSGEQIAHTFEQLDLMRDYCGNVACRHRALVEYFGQTFERESCGACDVCLQEMEEISDQTEIAQKILSCVVRLRDPFGAGYVASVLRGEKPKKIIERGHDELSTYGILADYSSVDVKDWIHQLVALGALRQSGVPYPVLTLGDSARAILRGAAPVKLMRRRGEETDQSRSGSAWEGVDSDLFDHLRGWRKGVAESRGVPPHVIFSDMTLRHLASIRPSSLTKMHAIYGMGDAKLREFGDEMLAMILAHCENTGAAVDQPLIRVAAQREPRRMTPQLSAAFDMFRRGASIEDVMAATGRARSTVGQYLGEFIAEERPSSVAAWVSPERYEVIAEVARRIGLDYLRPVKDELGEDFNYEEIRVVIEHLKRSGPRSGGFQPP
jgi:ATP-dependent DNA helicase RecQ